MGRVIKGIYYDSSEDAPLVVIALNIDKPVSRDKWFCKQMHRMGFRLI